ncbi:unnamed protein product [Caenorhabditis nigoni]
MSRPRYVHVLRSSILEEMNLCLEYLELGDNRIRKIENLGHLSKLRRLFLGANQIRKIENLDELQTLRELSLPGNAIQVIEGLDKLSGLRSFSVAQNGIRKIDGLSGLTSLVSLDLNDNIIEKLENVEQFKGVTNLMLRKNKLDSWQDLYQLLEMKGLTALTLEMNPIYSSDYTYRNRMKQILPEIKILDGFPTTWRQGDAYQPLASDFYDVFERLATAHDF